MPKVSVIIPNYNHARFLDQRIRSVLGQTFQDFEIIFLDDASTDNSREVFDRYAGDPHITKSIWNEVNSGSTFRQWNKGVRVAGGEYIWIAESDDYADERLLETLVARLNAHPNVGLAYCQTWEVTVGGEILRNCIEYMKDLDQHHWSEDYINNGLLECERYLVFRNSIPNASGVVFRKSFFDMVGGANEEMRLCGDWLLWLEILHESDVAFIAKPLNSLRSHAGTARIKYHDDRLAEKFAILSRLRQKARLSEAVLVKSYENFLKDWAWLILNDRMTETGNNKALSAAHSVAPDFYPRLLAALAALVAERQSYLTWLIEQQAAWQTAAEQSQQVIAEQKTWIAEIQQGKAWLEKQAANWQAVSQNQAAAIAELQSYLADQEKGKAWLKEQAANWQAVSQNQAATIAELQSNISHLVKRIVKRAAKLFLNRIKVKPPISK